MVPSKGQDCGYQPTTRPDSRIVRECLEGNQEAWSALVDTYKKLIFSIPIKLGFSFDEAADIFQTVCLELLVELPRICNPEALPKWIMQVTIHECLGRRRGHRRTDQWRAGTDKKVEPIPPRAEAVLREAEEEQALRQAVAGLAPRCRELIGMLFFEEPARRYGEIAKSLSMLAGSVGFTRQACLEKLRRRLTESGF
jgi:RNA polymerase sigma factor (sigma-70 family)